MIIGSMNNPNKDLLTEARWSLKHFDFLDLTLEMPKAYPGDISVSKLKAVIGGRPVVGHTAWYLPIGAPIKDLRLYAVAEFEKCLDVFDKLGVKKANIHFEKMEGLSDAAAIDANIWTLRKLVSLGRSYGITVMAENTPGLFSNPEVLGKIFAKVPRLMLHLDIAHANIGFRVNQSPQLMRMFRDKLTHVHASDNSGRGDEHIGIGKGSIKWSQMMGLLKLAGYDGTITIEVFSSPNERIQSANKLRRIWDDL